MTQILKNHTGVKEAREEFYQSGCESMTKEKGNKYHYDAGRGTEGFPRLLIEIRSHMQVGLEILFGTEDNDKTIDGTLGSYDVYISNNGNGTAEFKVLNSTTRESFTRISWGPLLKSVPRDETPSNWLSDRGWGGTLDQEFTWIEPIPPGICDGCP